MRTGTRRMWARRLLRAGWLVESMLRAPGRAFNYFWCDSYGNFEVGRVILTMIALGIGGAMSTCTVQVVRANTLASAQDVALALKDNPCMIEMMPRWVKKTNKPLSQYDLIEGKASCQAAWETHYAKIEQEKAMAFAGGKK